MRLIHPAAWIGIIINFYFAAQAVSFMQELSATDLMEMFQLTVPPEDISGTGKNILVACILLQLGALFLLTVNVRIAKITGVIGSLILLPYSLVYIVGLFYSANNVSYGFLPKGKGTANDNSRTFPSEYTNRYLLASAGCLCLTVLLISSSFYIFILFCVFPFSAIFLFLYYALRSKLSPPLKIYSQYILVTPNVFSSCFRLDYDKIAKAVLLEDETIRFDVKTRENTTDSFIFPIRSILEKERRGAVNSLADVLEKNHVELE